MSHTDEDIDPNYVVFPDDEENNSYYEAAPRSDFSYDTEPDQIIAFEEADGYATPLEETQHIQSFDTQPQKAMPEIHPAEDIYHAAPEAAPDTLPPAEPDPEPAPPAAKKVTEELYQEDPNDFVAAGYDDDFVAAGLDDDLDFSDEIALEPEPPEPEPEAEDPLPDPEPEPVAEIPEHPEPLVETHPTPPLVDQPPAPTPEVAEIESDHDFINPALNAPQDPALEKLSERENLLYTQGLVKVYDGRAVVKGVDINVKPGEIVALLGPNGAGKTTTFYMIVGIVPPNGGQVFFDSKEVTNNPMYQRARVGMGYLPQEESIFRKLTVEQNIMAVMETLNISKKERRSRCDELLERFGITHIAKNVALTCSGGEKRRLTIARSLVTQPSLLMLDEPFSGVDPIAVAEIQEIIKDLRESGLAILITDHNVRQTLEIVDRAYLIYKGQVLREGTRDFLINDPVSKELYLGEKFTM